MPLKGQAKTDYQRQYMRDRRAKGRFIRPEVRPIVKTPWVGTYGNTNQVELDADGNVIYVEG